MTLPFQTKWPSRMGELAGQPNYFVEKILIGLQEKAIPDVFTIWDCYEAYYSKYENTITAASCKCKFHSIRIDPNNRWKPGTKIHFVINNRTKNRFQFAPVIQCKSVQEIQIRYEDQIGYEEKTPMVFLKNRFSPLSVDEIEQLAINDGFPSVEAFFQYFNEDFKGKIIHWTDLKY